MAHFAVIDSDNAVIRVHVLNNEVIMKDGEEDEATGVEFLQNLHNNTDTHIQTSYNSNFRKNYAGIGYTYDGTRDAFIPPKPFNSSVLNEDTCQWEAPTSYPDDGKDYSWDEDSISWKENTTSSGIPKE
tara:strand:+ start:24 stop:410 length:387 start_codon:yes stop_codon:yes gene_type:complete